MTGDTSFMSNMPAIMNTGRFIECVAADGWEWVRRTNTSGAVGIVAITDDDELVLIDQHRIPTGKRVVELPAGLAGDTKETHGEAFAVAARRELIEETGYDPGELRHLVDGLSSAGLTDETITLFLATKLKKVGQGGGDHAEDINVHIVPLHAVHEWVQSRIEEGYGVDFKVFAGLYFACQYMAG